MVEKSVSSASFFWISDVLKPLVTKTSAKIINIITKDTTPYSLGISLLANIIETTKDIPCARSRSPNFQNKLETIPLSFFSLTCPV